MHVHPSVFRLSKRLWLFLPLAAIVSLAANLLSLSQHAFPGYSAALIAEAAGLTPPSGAAHPVFSLLVRQVAALDVFSLIVRLNLFSALCASLCASLLYVLAGRAILFSACEDGGGAECYGLMDDEAVSPDLQPEVEAYNRRIFKIALCGGLVASILFTFLAPAWSAATRLDNGPFDLALALMVLALYPSSDAPGMSARLALSVLLFVLGVFDSAAFLVLLPYGVYIFLSAFLHSERRASMVAVTAAAGVVGLALAVMAYLLNTGETSVARLLSVQISHVHDLAYHHLGELRSFFPASGWLLLLVQTGGPALVLLFGRPLLFKEKGPNTLIVLALVVAAAMPSLLNLPIAPFTLFQTLNHLPVFGAAILAAAVACAVSACAVLVGPDDRSADADLPGSGEDQAAWRSGFRKGAAGTILSVALAGIVAMPFCSFRAVDARSGAYADLVARKTLAAMDRRTCLVTNGMLDHHLLIQARMLGQPLTLIPVRSRLQAWEIEGIKAFISGSPIFEGLNRQRLLNALSIGSARFVMEWFNTDANARRHAMAFASPAMWTACGYHAVPEGLAFGGYRAEAKPDLPRLVAQNREFAEYVTPLLARQSPEEGYVAALRARLRMKAGFVSNELGVLLEEQGDLEGAFSAYARASAIDPVNVSAAINLYTLNQLRGVHPEAGDALKKRMKNALANAHVEGQQDIAWVLQNHGSINQQIFYRQQQVTWSSLGMGSAAVASSRKAQSLSAHTGVDAMLEDAAIYQQIGDLANAEKCYRAVLALDASNRDALIRMCTLMISQKKVEDAETWYRKALDAAVDPLALRYQAVSIAILNNETDRAIHMLEVATREVPLDLRYWTLLADQLLRRGETIQVERKLLPDMQKALKTSDHYLVYAIRGMALRSKGPGAYKEARRILLLALSLNASLPDIWRILLETDLAIGQSAFTESDVRRLLGIDPDHALANYLMGALLLSRGALPESEDFLRRSLEKQPTAAAYNDLAENLRLQKKLPEAEACARRALEAAPDLLPAQDTLACVLLDAGRYDESVKAAMKSAAADSSCVAYQLTLLRAQVKVSNRDGVRQCLRALSECNAVIPEPLQKEINAMK